MKIKHLLLVLGLGLAVLPAQGFADDPETADVEECPCGMDENDNCLQCEEERAPAVEQEASGTRTDTGTDTATDKGTDTGTDTGTDAGTDTTTTKTAPEEKTKS